MNNKERLVAFTIKKLQEGILWGEDSEYDKDISKKMNDWISDVNKELIELGWTVEQVTYGSMNLPIWKYKKDDRYCKLNANFDKVGVMDISDSNLDLNYIANAINADNSEYANDDGYIPLDADWKLPSAYLLANTIDKAKIME